VSAAPARRCDAGAVSDFAELPAFAAWRLVGLVDGFEVVYITPGRLRGHTSAVEDGRPYAVRYEIAFDDRWRTREARVASDTLAGPRETVLVADGRGIWTVDGRPAPHLDGVLDVDLEASACTNALPVHRLAFPPGEVVAASAACVRALDLTTKRLHQTYRRREDCRFDYTSEDDFEAVLHYDASGLTTTPGSPRASFDAAEIAPGRPRAANADATSMHRLSGTDLRGAAREHNRSGCPLPATLRARRNQ
jgi:uncharacterized protein